MSVAVRGESSSERDDDVSPRSGDVGRALACSLLPAMTTAQDKPAPAPPPQAPTVKETVEVVAVTPILGLGVPRALVPAAIQVLTVDDMQRSPNVSFGALAATRMASVNLNETQVNPFQPDVQFRGFVASPLLGLPQGLAVYQDGVRANEPFGDTMNWDLIPMNAIASVTFMPGSSPLFGLNALGGALSLQTKTGFSHPGVAVSSSIGAFGRRWIDCRSRRAQRPARLLRGRAFARGRRLARLLAVHGAAGCSAACNGADRRRRWARRSWSPATI